MRPILPRASITALLLLAALPVSALGASPAASTSSATALFNGHNLDGWTAVADPRHPSAATWTVQDGMIVCTGRPHGYLRTDATYADFRLRLQWRWPGKPGNSGVFVYGSGPDKIWPRCYEANLLMGRTGEFRANGGARFQANSPAGEKSRLRRGADCERPAGEWNDLEIVCDGHDVRLYVNGALQNHLGPTVLGSGWIALQSEGAPVEFRHITLERLR